MYLSVHGVRPVQILIPVYSQRLPQLILAASATSVFCDCICGGVPFDDSFIAVNDCAAEFRRPTCAPLRLPVSRRRASIVAPCRPSATLWAVVRFHRAERRRDWRHAFTCRFSASTFCWLFGLGLPLRYAAADEPRELALEPPASCTVTALAHH